eukprot:TRINITY_DN14217_c0_g1_i1.p1 TRINITY_DN14217_c0_g1~~TRINITY_DN14217_c0_g1_i1.p1  ORF type:complete len:194 (+),score=80.27 TRINITY_DN14217_c0_g1_i1:114-695(+)
MNFLAPVVLLLLVAVAFAGTPNIQGTYRQINYDTNDVTIAVIEDDDDYVTRTTYTFGVNEFTVEAKFRIEFEDDDSGDQGVWNVKYEYLEGTATPHSADAIEALENSCSGSFRLNEPTTVVDCLFCGGDRYDIFRTTDKGFEIGEGIACSRTDRPTRFEEYEFEEIRSASAASVLSACMFTVLLSSAIALLFM